MENLPSKSVVIPVLVPLIRTLANGIASLNSSSITDPVIFVCPNENKDETVKIKTKE